MTPSSVPRVLVVAGSDSSGGAGLEADQKVLAAHKCYAMTATTALTAQTTENVWDVHDVPAEFVKKQIDLCANDIGIDVLKTGMLASLETVKAVAKAIREHSIALTVVDPVMISTSGAQLLPGEAVSSLVQDLLPVTTILTPNIPEANLLVSEAGHDCGQPKTLAEMIQLAKLVQRLGPKYVLLKGGHLPITVANGDSENHETQVVFNVLASAETEPIISQYPFINTRSTHGTGCSLAAAISANLGHGLDVSRAVKQALDYVDGAIRTSIPMGKGHGPINHFHNMIVLPFTTGKFVDYLLERPDVRDAWHQYTHHEFVQQLGDGSLPVEKFRDYLIQDYLYLVQFSRANALAAYKARAPDDIQRSAAIVLHIYKEMSLHLDYCAEFGLSREDILNKEEQLACMGYTRFFLDIGQSDDAFALQMALFPCLLGYGMIAQRLYHDPNTRWEGNKYAKWIRNYAAEDFTQAVTLGRAVVEKLAMQQSPQRIERLVEIFIQATKLESGFWDMGLAGSS